VITVSQVFSDDKLLDTLLFDTNIVGIFLWDFDGRILQANEAFLHILGYEREDLVAGLRWSDLTPPDLLDPQAERLREHQRTGRLQAFEKEYFRKDGTRVPVLVGVSRFGERGNQGVAFVLDLSQHKRAEEEHRAHVWFLESMDRINRAMQATSDLEQMMSDVLEEVLDIFVCDRAWLVYPCDPQTASWRVVMERTRPPFLGGFAQQSDIPTDAGVAAGFAAARTSGGVLLDVPAEMAKRFAVRSRMAMAVYPKGDAPYLFGLHQCSRERAWTADEQRLFEEVGHRLTDALSNLIAFRSLRDSERRLEAAQRLAHVGWWERDYATSHAYLSDQASRIFGVEPLDLPQWHGRWVSLIHPEDREKTAAASDAALRGGPRYDVEYRVVRPDGAVRVVHSQGDVTWDEAGRPMRQFGVMQDITDLRRAEDQLRASEARFRTFVDHASDAFFLHEGERLNLIDVNRQACESLGYSRAELIGKHPRDFDARLDMASFARLAEQVATGETVSFETLHRRKDGTVFPVEVRVHQFQQGDRRFHLSLARDISERRRAENALREKDDALQTARTELARVSRLTTLGELTASIAHEVSQPLGAMIASAAAGARWLASDPPDMAEARSALDTIVADGKRARDVIGRIRALTKRQAPRMELLDINRKVLEVVALAEHELRSHDIVLQTQLEETLPRVTGDRVQLQQVLLNLIVNAIEAMSAVHDRTREMTIVSGQDGPNALVVEVRDSGTGLDPERAERLFEAFYTTKAEGIGIGLSISRSIIEAHGGRLWAGANEPHGAVFRFSLPVSEEGRS
jgi:PAS domain S-box-containing protein